MKLGQESLVTIVLLFVGALGLGACQTTTPTKSDTTPKPAEAKPAEVKPAEAPKPVAPETARNLANNCFTCHGPNGRSPGSIPSLTNLSADDIATRLKNFKTGATASTVMGRHAKGYSDAELDAVATYIAELKK
jgi:cytochrome subunit of sulfide dehydrogenase